MVPTVPSSNIFNSNKKHRWLVSLVVYLYWWLVVILLVRLVVILLYQSKEDSKDNCKEDSKAVSYNIFSPAE